MIPKFRAWYAPFGGSVKKFNKMEHGSAGSLLTLAEMSPDDYKIMQSTGLKDKNGLKIYEGDCFIKAFKTFRNIEIPTKKNEIQKSVGIVKFHEGAFQVHVVGQGYELLSQVVQLNFLRANIDHWEWESVVVGNIYENPELLNLR